MPFAPQLVATAPGTPSPDGQPPSSPGMTTVSESSAKLPKSQLNEESDQQRAERAVVKQWQERIKAAKKKFDPDFKRMEENMQFAAGLQWKGQESLLSDKYTANITLRSISQKVSSLYARDPQAVPRRRERLDYQLWDGKMESLIAAVGAVQMSSQSMLPPPPEALALMQDFQSGQQWEQMLDKVARTMKILYHYQMDEQEPEFKEQLKQLVATTCTCGVAFARMSFVRDMTTPIGSTQIGGDVMDRVKRIRGLTEQYEKDNASPDSPITEQIRQLANSLITGMQFMSPDNVETERIVWDFPSPMSVIVDPSCKALMGFIGAQWVAQEYLLPITEINSYFELRGKDMVSGSGDVTKYDKSGKEQNTTESDGKTDTTEKPLCCLWEVFNNRDKTRFFIVDGHKDYVQPPDALTPKTKRFWPLFALTFNRIAIEPCSGVRASIYPPSDVDLMKPMQREWNRSREELREHRIANAPFYIASKAAGLTSDDKDKIAAARSHEVIEVSGVMPGVDLKTVIMAMPVKDIQPQLYDTGPSLQDINLTIGSQSADLGQQQAGDTATGQQISEQARLSTTASNVDDLDGFLSRMARAGGEMLLREMSSDYVKKIVGQGAIWPDTDADKENFLNSLYLETEAASSGRPNGALEMKKWQAAAPVLQAAGANPQFMVRKTLETLDSRIEPAEAFPLIPQSAPPQGNQPKPSTPNESKGGPQPQVNSNQQPQNPRNQHNQPTL